MQLQPSIHIAWFITPHGFGHAARAAAVMLELNKRAAFHFEIFTRVPTWFFAESFLQNYTYHECQTDIGLVQRTSLDEDLDATLSRLDDFLPFSPQVVAALAQEVTAAGCRFVVCDIAPLGIAVAEAAGLPSILIENFTWDWIYTGYPEKYEELSKYIAILNTWFSRAAYHVQTEPVCEPRAGVITTLPVSRPRRQSSGEIRARLGIEPDVPMVLITMGGIDSQFTALENLSGLNGARFVIPGGSLTPTRAGSAILLPHHSGFYHPDLMNACDAVIGKLGYSTLAEAYAADIPFGFIPRLRFRESPPLAKYCLERMQALEISEQSFASGEWVAAIPALLEMKRREPPAINGAGQLAAWLIKTFAF